MQWWVLPATLIFFTHSYIFYRLVQFHFLLAFQSERYSLELFVCWRDEKIKVNREKKLFKKINIFDICLKFGDQHTFSLFKFEITTMKFYLWTSQRGWTSYSVGKMNFQHQRDYVYPVIKLVVHVFLFDKKKTIVYFFFQHGFLNIIYK